MKKTNLVIALGTLCFGFVSNIVAIQAEETVKAPETKKLYRYVDKNGNVHYSDQPSEGAKEVQIQQVPSISIAQPKIEFESLEDQNERKRDPNAPYYQNFVFTSPEHDGVIRNNGAVVPFSVSLTPTLSRGHFIKFFIDGLQVSDQQKELTFQAENVEYGPHTASFSVVDQNGKQVQVSDKISFSLLHVVRKKALYNTGKVNDVYTANLPEHPKAPTYDSMKKTGK